MTHEKLIEQARQWLEALLCASLDGNKRAGEIYAIAKRIADGEEVNAMECATFESYCLWVQQRGRDDCDVKQYALCDGCNDVLLPVGHTCKCGAVNTAEFDRQSVSVRIINTFDPSGIVDRLRSKEAERTIINVMQRNAGSLRASMAIKPALNRATIVIALSFFTVVLAYGLLRAFAPVGGV